MPVALGKIRDVVKPGDAVVLAQGPSQPLTLSEMLLEAGDEIGDYSVFLGGLFSDVFDPKRALGARYAGYGVIGAGAMALSKAGRLGIVTDPYGSLSNLFARRLMKADVVLLHLARDAEGRLAVGLTNDYAVDAARHARHVVAEINDRLPWVEGAELPADINITHQIEVSRDPISVQSAPVGDVEKTIAGFIAELMPDGATLQFGIGAIPDAILGSLGSHRRLGLHSGMLGDRVADLVEQGVITNEEKPIDRGLSVTNVVLGSEKVRRFVDHNKSVRLPHTSYTHAIATIAAIPNFYAINSAIEVDLTGQVNSETVGGRYIGAVGGQPDFVRGARASEGGRSIIALPSTARGGSLSRIVASLDGGVVSTPRCDADVIVTEWGVAELRGLTLGDRARRMVAIAAPQFREALDRHIHEHLKDA